MTAVNGYEVALNRATITAFLAVYDGDVARFAGDDYATRCHDVARATARLVIEPAEAAPTPLPPVRPFLAAARISESRKYFPGRLVS